MAFKRFSFALLEDIEKECAEQGLKLPFSTDTGILGRPVEMDGFMAPNSIAVHPMEGSDSNSDGSPGTLTERRYKRFAASGAGLIWFEAVAVVTEGKASPRQLHITRENTASFGKLRDMIRRTAETESGKGSNPVCIMQLTHSGRFSKPEGKPAPIIAYHSKYLNTRLNLEPTYPVISDSELERLEEKFEEAALLARNAGFEGVDIKCCHRYLNSELLSAFYREGRYGGNFEGRTRFLLNVVDRIKSRLGNGFIVSTRLNVYDGIPFPFGWGTDHEDYSKYDLAEPLKLVGLLVQRKVELVNITMGTPYYNPHVNRPYDSGGYVPEENPLAGVARLVNGTGEIQKAYPNLKITGTGYSWLRQFSPYLAAGCIKNGMTTFAGFGREAIAYPEFARDILNKGRLDPKKCCISCSKCSDILRTGGTAGCVVRDAKVYAPVYTQYCIKGDSKL